METYTVIVVILHLILSISSNFSTVTENSHINIEINETWHAGKVINKPENERFALDCDIDQFTSIFFVTKHVKRVKCSRYQIERYKSVLLLERYVAVNPGPTRFPCDVCNRPVAVNHRALQCDGCSVWTHIKCG